MGGSAKPDYDRCVDIVTVGALEGMIAPGLLAVATPVLVGVLFKLLATRDDATLGAEAVAAALMVGTITGVLLALLMNTGGGAWDNAKKVIESGELRRQALEHACRRGRGRRRGRPTQGHGGTVAPCPHQAARHRLARDRSVVRVSWLCFTPWGSHRRIRRSSPALAREVSGSRTTAVARGRRDGLRLQPGHAAHRLSKRHLPLAARRRTETEDGGAAARALVLAGAAHHLPARGASRTGRAAFAARSATIPTR